MTPLRRVLAAWALGASSLTALGNAVATPALDDDPLGDPRFATVGAQDIPRGVVASLAQDAAGFLWVATGDGLVRFDGHRFHPVERDSPDPLARNLGWVRALLATRDGRLWIGTESDGLVVYDPATDAVADLRDGAVPAVPAVPSAAAGPHPPLPTIRALAEDLDGSLWVGSLGGGLARVHPAGQRFERYLASEQAGSLPHNRVLALQVDRVGDLWVGHRGGLAVRRRGSAGFDPIHCADSVAEGPGMSVQALLVAADGAIWAGTTQGALARVDPATRHCTRIGQAASLAPMTDPVNSLAQDADGRVWVGRTLGIDLHDPADGHLLRRLRHDPARPSGLGANEVSSLLRDQSQAMWVGSLGGGLQRVDAVQRPLRVRRGDLGSDGLFQRPDARALLARSDGGLWAALADGPVVRLDARLRVQGLALADDPAPSRPAGRVDALLQAADGGAWLGSEGMVRRVAPDGRERLRLRHDAGLTHRLWSTRDGRLWVATQDGLFVLTPGDRQLQRVPQANGPGLTGDVFALAEDADGSLLAGGVQGLFRMAPGDTRLQPVVSTADEGLGNPIVLGLLLDSAGRLWVDTAVAGLHLRLPGDGPIARFDRISLRHGVRNRPFGVNLLADRRGRIWTHMYVYDPADDSLTALTAADGADMGTGWFRSYTQLADGRFVFGGSQGLLVVEPEQFEPARYAPPVRVSGLRINGQPARMAGLAEGLNIRPGQRNFSVEFTALDYADPQRTRFGYRLDGVDPDWIATTADFRQASYGNLTPGQYVLRVRASNRAGVWNPEALALPVRVWPAWWQTGWWRTLATLLGIGLSVFIVGALVRRRTQALQTRQAALAKEVAERTAELSAMAETLRERSAALEQASLTDPLTQLHNRRYLSQHIDADCALAVRQWSAPRPGPAGQPTQADLVFFLCDIDHFKGLNDHHGHAAGDAVLRQMRQRLQQVFRDSDHLVRWGGEEFLIVARGTSRASAAELADRLRHAVADLPMTLDDGTPCPVSVSTGFAAFPASTSHPEALGWEDTVALADAALLAVKRARRGAWAGVLQVDGDSVAKIRAAARLPVERWATAHQLSWVASVVLHPADDR